MVSKVLSNKYRQNSELIACQNQELIKLRVYPINAFGMMNIIIPYVYSIFNFFLLNSNNRFTTLNNTETNCNQVPSL